MNISAHQQPEKWQGQFPDFIFHAFQNAPNGILIIDADMNIIFSNDYMLNYFDIPPYLAGGLALGSFLRCSGHKNNLCGQVPECRNCSIRKGVTKIFREGTTIHGMTIRLVCNIAGNEKTKWFSISGSILFHIDEVYCILSFMDITAYKHKELRLLEKLELDLPTQTLNKHSLFKYLDGLLWDKRHFTLCMMDFDYFKVVNDNHGHLIGDEVLKTFADISRRNIRTGDIIGRYGGEEFVFAFPDTGLDDAIKIIVRIQKEMKEYFSSLLTCPVSFSVGMMHVDDKECPPHDYTGLINHVDKLLYEAKSNGKNRLVTDKEEYPF